MHPVTTLHEITVNEGACEISWITGVERLSLYIEK